MRYSRGFKATAVRKTLDGTGRSITRVASELGIYPATLSQWIHQHKAGILSLDEGDSIPPNDRHAGEKLALLLESKTIEPEDMGEWLRTRGLHSEHLPLWEQELTSTMQDTWIQLVSATILPKRGRGAIVRASFLCQEKEYIVELSAPLPRRTIPYCCPFEKPALKGRDRSPTPQAYKHHHPRNA